MAGWFNALKKTREGFVGAISRVFGGGKVDAETLEELEEALLRADVHPRLAAEMIAELEKATRKQGGDARNALRSLLLSRLLPAEGEPLDLLPAGACVLMLGVNGSGKTTTSAKLAHRAKRQGKRVVLGAADTFRAAGTEQLRIWADRVGVDVVAGQQGADASAVAFDALQALRARKADLLFIDTAGRMHTKRHLMDELEKMVRALAKCDPAAPHAVWMVLDASIGRNALNQARIFHQTVPLTGLVVTKLDGSSKAGFLFSVQQEIPGVPVLFSGLGEQEDDLVPFDPAAFVDSLLDSGAA